MLLNWSYNLKKRYGNSNISCNSTNNDRMRQNLFENKWWENLYCK